jgi:hypothetical protein
MSTPRELTEAIEEVERRLADPSSGMTGAERQLLTMSRVSMVGQLGDLQRDHLGETEAEAMRRLAHDSGGQLLGTFDSARPENPLQEERDILLQSVLRLHGAECMSHVEAAMFESDEPEQIPEWQQAAREAAGGY